MTLRKFVLSPTGSTVYIEYSGSSNSQHLLYLYEEIMTTTTTTICQRPAGLPEYSFYSSIKPQTGSTWENFIDTLNHACDALSLVLGGGYNMAGQINNVASLTLGEPVWSNANHTDCTLISSGYYIINNSGYKIYHVQDGYIDGIDLSCIGITTTTTTT